MDLDKLRRAIKIHTDAACPSAHRSFNGGKMGAIKLMVHSRSDSFTSGHDFYTLSLPCKLFFLSPEAFVYGLLTQGVCRCVMQGGGLRKWGNN